MESKMRLISYPRENLHLICQLLVEGAKHFTILDRNQIRSEPRIFRVMKKFMIKLRSIYKINCHGEV